MPVLIPIEQTQFANFLGVTPDNDQTVPSIYDGKRINANSMQLTSSIKIFGTEKVLEQETDKLKQKGVEVLARSQDKSEAYFDTRGEGNIMIRLMQGKSS